MKILQARSRGSGPDQYVLEVLPENDPSFYFNVRYSLPDATLVPLDEQGTAVMVIRNGAKSVREVSGVKVAPGIWRFDLVSSDVYLTHQWRVDSIMDSRRITHALGTFTSPSLQQRRR